MVAVDCVLINIETQPKFESVSFMMTVLEHSD